MKCAMILISLGVGTALLAGAQFRDVVWSEVYQDELAVGAIQLLPEKAEFIEVFAMSSGAADTNKLARKKLLIYKHIPSVELKMASTDGTVVPPRALNKRFADAIRKPIKVTFRNRRAFKLVAPGRTNNLFTVNLKETFKLERPGSYTLSLVPIAYKLTNDFDAIAVRLGEVQLPVVIPESALGP